MKPEREIYRLVAERLGVSFGEMVFIDDMQQYINAAVSYGIRSIQYRDLDSMKRQLQELLK